MCSIRIDAPSSNRYVIVYATEMLDVYGKRVRYRG